MAMSSIWDKSFQLILATPIITEEFTTTLNDLITDLYNLSFKQNYELKRLGRLSHENEFKRLKVLVEVLFPPDPNLVAEPETNQRHVSLFSDEIPDNQKEEERNEEPAERNEEPAGRNKEPATVMMDVDQEDKLVEFEEIKPQPTFKPKHLLNLQAATKISNAFPVSKVIKIEVITDKNGVIKGAKNVPQPRNILCNRCHKVFTNNLNIKGVHSLNICKQCHSKNNNIQKLTDGLQIRHQSFDIKNDLVKKFKQNFPTQERFGIDYDSIMEAANNDLYQCTHCDYFSKIERNLQKHMLVHTSKRDHKCTICDKTFTRSDHLKRHIRIHTGEKPYKCVFCDYSCARSCHLNNHITTHTAGLRPFKCCKCDKRFIQITQLKLHMKTHYGFAERYGCGICKFEAAETALLVEHTKANHLVERSRRMKLYNEIKPSSTTTTTDDNDVCTSTTVSIMTSSAETIQEQPAEIIAT